MVFNRGSVVLNMAHYCSRVVPRGYYSWVYVIELVLITFADISHETCTEDLCC